MKIVKTNDGMALHIISSITNNSVTSKGKYYNYKRLVIPNVIMDYFFGIKSKLVYVYLYFYEDSIFLSVERISGIKFSKRKIMKFGKKNSFFINLNEKSLSKHNVSIGENVLFVVNGDNSLFGSDSISIELIF